MTVRYGKRTGWSKLRWLMRQLCRLYRTFSGTIDAWAQQNLSPEGYTTFKTFTAMIGPVCVLIDSIPDD